jgi:multidrug efflux system outer membrane protein
MRAIKKHSTFLKQLCGLLLITSVFFSCKLMQSYKRPDVVDNNLYRDVATKDTNSIAEVPWRQMFSDTLLQRLINEGINNNLDLKVAVARMAQAQANYNQSIANFFPTLTATASAAFQHLSPSQIGRPQVYQASLASSWEIGIWGKLRGAKRAAMAALLASDAYRRAVQTQLVADIASNYYLLLAYDAQLNVTLKTVEFRKEDVETMTLLKESDVVTGAAVVQSEANRYSAEVTLPDIKQNIRVTENLMSVLLGRDPGAIARDSLQTQQITTELKTGVPVQLLANRPDVQEAEYNLRYYFELTNVARAYFYPSLTITAAAGFANSNLANLFTPAAFFNNFIAGLMQPIFNKGLNLQRLAIAKAQQAEYMADFRQTVLTAGEEVSNALSNYQAASDKIVIRTQQVSFLQKSVDYTKELLKYTANTNYTDVLTSEQNLLAAQLNGINDKLQQLQSVVELYRSLGGGWK